jgi:hypothetical protein
MSTDEHGRSTVNAPVNDAIKALNSAAEGSYNS